MFQSVYYKVYRFFEKLKKKKIIFFTVFLSVRIIEIYFSYIVENWIELKL